jgi:hypothetical protein
MPFLSSLTVDPFLYLLGVMRDEKSFLENFKTSHNVLDYYQYHQKSLYG